MPTFIHSKLSKLKIDVITTPSPIAVTLTDISDHCDNVDMPEDLELVETTTFGVTSKTYIVGFSDGKLNISGNWSRVMHGRLGALKRAFRDGDLQSITFEYGPEGTDTGDIKITGEMVMVNYNKTSEAKSQVKFSAEFQITGEVTETTY